MSLSLSAPARGARLPSRGTDVGAQMVSALGEFFDTYPTQEAAQVAALRSIVERRSERGGAVLFNPRTDRYAYTATVGQGEAAHFQAAVRIPPGWLLDSLYHTHPQGAESRRFSAEDLEVAQRLGVPSYVLSRYDNRIRRFDPRTSAVIRAAGGNSSEGELLDELPAVPGSAARSAALVFAGA